MAALLRADETGGTPYAETVLTYLGTMGDIARTAAAMNVHENTVRYRIRRAEEVYGLDLADPDRVLVTWLQLRLAKVAPSAGEVRVSLLVASHKQGRAGSQPGTMPGGCSAH